MKIINIVKQNQIKSTILLIIFIIVIIFLSVFFYESEESSILNKFYGEYITDECVFLEPVSTFPSKWSEISDVPKFNYKYIITKDKYVMIKDSKNNYRDVKNYEDFLLNSSGDIIMHQPVKFAVVPIDKDNNYVDILGSKFMINFKSNVKKEDEIKSAYGILIEPSSKNDIYSEKIPINHPITPPQIVIYYIDGKYYSEMNYSTLGFELVKEK